MLAVPADSLTANFAGHAPRGPVGGQLDAAGRHFSGLRAGAEHVPELAQLGRTLRAGPGVFELEPVVALGGPLLVRDLVHHHVRARAEQLVEADPASQLGLLRRHVPGPLVHPQ